MAVVVTPDLLRETVEYDPETGLLYWKERPRSMFSTEMSWKMWNGKHVGNEAFSYADKRGAKSCRSFGKAMWAHRVAWAIHFGEWPTKEIDHINGDPGDNRICNLRQVTRAENMRNTRKVNAASGAYGIYWARHVNRWRVRLQFEGKVLSLGYYDDFEDAKRARVEAQKSLGFHPNHGVTNLADLTVPVRLSKPEGRATACLHPGKR
jgi:hypothetical protein